MQTICEERAAESAVADERVKTGADIACTAGRRSRYDGGARAMWEALCTVGAWTDVMIDRRLRWPAYARSPVGHGPADIRALNTSSQLAQLGRNENSF